MCCLTNLKPSIPEIQPGRSTYRWDRDTRSLKDPSGTLEMSFPWSVLEGGEAGRYQTTVFCLLPAAEGMDA